MLLWCTLCTNTHGQSTELDSLMSLTKKYLFTHQDSAKKYLAIYRIVSDRIKDEHHLVQSYKLYGIWHDVQSNFQVSLQYYDSGIQLAERLEDSKSMADISHNIGYLQQRNGNFEQSVEYFLQSMEKYLQVGDSVKWGSAQVSLANTYNKVGATDKAKKKYHDALTALRGLNAHQPVAQCLVGLGVLYSQSEQLDSAIIMYEEAITHLDEMNDLRGSGIIQNNLGAIYIKKKRYDEAVRILNASMKKRTQFGDQKGMLSVLRNLSDAYKLSGNLDSALIYARSGYQQALQLNDKALTRDYAFELADIYAELGQYQKATGFYQQHIHLDDSLIGAERAKAVAEIEEQYNDEVKLRKISELELQNQKTINQRNIMLSLAGILMIIIGFVIIYTLRSRKVNRILSAKNEQVSIALKDKEVLLKEIHHRVKNNLQTVSSLLSLQSRYLNEEALEAMEEGRNRVKSMALIHQKLYQTDNLKGIILNEYVKNLVDGLIASYGMSTDELKVNLDVDPINLDVDSAIPLGLILNELVSNTFKYAFTESKEKQLSIAIKKASDAIHLKIADNGVGLPEDFDPKQSKSFGLKLVQTLAHKLDAEMTIANSNGTMIDMEIKKYQLA